MVVSTWFYNPFPTQVLKVVTVVQDKTDIDEQYEVYSVLIDELFIKNKSSINSLTIFNQTLSYNENAKTLKYLNEKPFQQRVEDLKRNYSSVAEDTLADYETKALQPLTLQKKFNIPVQYNFVTEEEVEKNGGRAATRLVVLSQVGFNKSRTQAFVNVNYYCPLCGFGNNILLEKHNGAWQIKEQFGGWVS